MFRNVFLSMFCLALLLSAAQATGASPASEGLRRSILALDSAWTMALRDLQEKKQAGTLSETEQDEYARFVTYLGSRISEYCSLLRASNDPNATADLPCPAENNQAEEADTPPPPSSTEQVAALDQSLAEALGSFDEMLLSEEERLNQRLPRQRESGGTANNSGTGQGGAAGQGGAGGSGRANKNGAQQGGAGGSDSGQGNEAGGNSANSKNSGNQQATNGNNRDDSPAGGAGAGSGGGSPHDDRRAGSEIESGYDDIVARQLREAAEKETDPELKEKLWEEYRKYKQGAL